MISHGGKRDWKRQIEDEKTLFGNRVSGDWMIDWDNSSFKNSTSWKFFSRNNSQVLKTFVNLQQLDAVKAHAKRSIQRKNSV